MMKKMLRKKKENRKVADRGCSKLRKIEGNPNITSKRLTIPPGFLGLGVKSETIRKSSGKEEYHKEKDFILKENLHGLFNTCLSVNPINVRRSERILKKKCAINTSRYSASEYYDKVINEHKILESELTPINKERSLFQNKSKSLFREINEKYNARAECLNTNFNFLTPPQDSPLGDDSSEEEVKSRRINNSNFCKNLCREVRLNLGNKVLLECKSRIIAKIQRINCIISGKVDPETMMEKEPHTLGNNINSRECEEVKFQYVPKSQWVYDTPPRQRMHVQRVEECQMRPAVLCSTKKQTNIYEMNTNSKLDLSNCSSRQDVELDNNFLKRVGSFEHKMNGNKANECEFSKKFSQQINTKSGIHPFNFYKNKSQPSGSEDNSFCLVQPVPDNPFYNLVSRPRKSVKTDSRLHNVMKRKLDNDYDDPSFINKPSSSQICEQTQNVSFTGDTIYSSKSQTPKFNFDFKRKLFDDRRANKNFFFNNEKSNLFDFSQ